MQPAQYLSQDSLAFCQDFAIREAQNLITAAVQFLSSNAIGHHRFRLEMLPTVEFDNQHRFDTGEVREVRTDRPLATEFVAVELTVAKRRPQASLRVG